jgi:hypothetical protein
MVYIDTLYNDDTRMHNERNGEIYGCLPVIYQSPSSDLNSVISSFQEMLL